jgi:ElaB/YqjD/DUF883 family membrane-anchored ribosome-binding protein
VALEELVLSIYDRMESKLMDIEKKNLEKVEDPEKLKEAIAKALEEVRKGREEVKQLLESSQGKDPEELLKEIEEHVKKTMDAAKQYLGKDQTGLKTAKATFSRCVNSYKRKVWPKIEAELGLGSR